MLLHIFQLQGNMMRRLNQRRNLFLQPTFTPLQLPCHRNFRWSNKMLQQATNATGKLMHLFTPPPRVLMHWI
jgi:hypothetical protein